VLTGCLAYLWLSPAQVEGLNIVVENIIGSTGLELKADLECPWCMQALAPS
jgi:hypothetical protein